MAKLPSEITGKSVEEIMKEWNAELQERSGKFRMQANAIDEWDRRILHNRDVLLRLEIDVAKVVETQSNLEHQLWLIETHQEEVDKALQSMEGEANRIYKDECGLLLDDEAASTRDAMYEQAEFIERELEQMIEQIKSIIQTLNANQGGELDSNNTMTQLDVVVKILNNLLSFLMWIDEKEEDFQERGALKEEALETESDEVIPPINMLHSPVEGCHNEVEGASIEGAPRQGEITEGEHEPPMEWVEDVPDEGAIGGSSDACQFFIVLDKRTGQGEGSRRARGKPSVQRMGKSVIVDSDILLAELPVDLGHRFITHFRQGDLSQFEAEHFIDLSGDKLIVGGVDVSKEVAIIMNQVISDHPDIVPRRVSIQLWSVIYTRLGYVLLGLENNTPSSVTVEMVLAWRDVCNELSDLNCRVEFLAEHIANIVKTILQDNCQRSKRKAMEAQIQQARANLIKMEVDFEARFGKPVGGDQIPQLEVSNLLSNLLHQQ